MDKTTRYREPIANESSSPMRKQILNPIQESEKDRSGLNSLMAFLGTLFVHHNWKYSKATQDCVNDLMRQAKERTLSDARTVIRCQRAA